MPREQDHHAAEAAFARLPLRTRLAVGKALRKAVPRKQHAAWKPFRGRNPIALIRASNRPRVARLVPIRYQRMLESAFAYLRGSAAVMAADLARTPTTGVAVQAGGDCHLLNFGTYATPERNLVFDVNDFDETLHAPWEWDVKRLAASIVLAARHNGMRHSDEERAVRAAVRSYRERMRAYADLPSLDVWYSRIDATALERAAAAAGARKKALRGVRQAKKRTVGLAVPKLTELVGNRRRIVDHPPLIYHSPQLHSEAFLRGLFTLYADSLRSDVRVLFDRYELVDVAAKVVGVGSVGTRCGVALMMAGPDDWLLLQVKEALVSALAPYVRPHRYSNEGERVVTGQRLMQAASDIFLGWFRGLGGRDYYVRQLRDMKGSIEVDGMSAELLCGYASLCGWALARAHARSGRPAVIAGYLGRADAFDIAIARFAQSYADQTERDYRAFATAVKAGRLRSRR